MIFKEALHRTSWNDFQRCFQKNYPHEFKNIKSYRAIFVQLPKILVEVSDSILMILSTAENEGNLDVFVLERDSELGHYIDKFVGYISWPQILGLMIKIESDKEINLVDIITWVLYKKGFLGDIGHSSYTNIHIIPKWQYVHRKGRKLKFCVEKVKTVFEDFETGFLLDQYQVKLL